MDVVEGETLQLTVNDATVDGVIQIAPAFHLGVTITLYFVPAGNGKANVSIWPIAPFVTVTPIEMDWYGTNPLSIACCDWSANHWIAVVSARKYCVRFWSASRG